MKTLKTLPLCLILASAALAQTTPFTITGAISTAEFTAVEAYRITQFAPGQLTIPTLGSTITAGATTLTISALPAGWTQGLAANIPATCVQINASSFALNLYFATDSLVISTCVATNTWGVFASEIVIDNEAMDVASFSGTTLTVVRARANTVAAAHTAGAAINILRYPNAILLAKQFIRDGLAGILGNGTNDAAIQAAKAQLAADQATLVTLQQQAVR